MKLGIYDIDRVDLSIKERFKIYKDVGFSHVGFYFDNSYLKENEKYIELIKSAKDVGLSISQLHLDYKNSNMLSINEDNEFLRYIEIKIDEAINYGVKQLVLHASKGNNAPPISSYSIKRLKKLSKKLVKYDVELCFENVRDNTNLEKIMSLRLENINMCYDTGHAHCYSNEKELLNRYKTKITATHIHDNFDSDDHNKLGEGNIEWSTISSLLNTTKRKVDYLECFPLRGIELSKEKFISFVKDLYDSYNTFFEEYEQDDK